MRTAVAFALVGSLVLVLAGCLQTPPEDEPLSHEEGTAGDEPFAPADDPSPDGQNEPTENEGDEAAPDGSGPSAAEGCAADDPPTPPHPDEHKVDTRDAIRCPGQFAVIQEGNGASWDVPIWSTGDWWLYEHRDNQGNCERIRETINDDTQVLFERTIYTMEFQRYEGCSEEKNGAPTLQNRTQDSLMHITDDGFIRHDMVFPLREGKQWAMAGNCERGCVIMEVYEVSHIEDYEHQGQTLEVWYTEWSFERAGNEIIFKRWWSVEHNALLLEEMWFAHMATPLVEKELVDHGTQ